MISFSKLDADRSLVPADRVGIEMERLGRCIREPADWELAREWELLVPWLEKEVLRVCTEESSCDSDKDCESDLELVRCV